MSAEQQTSKREVDEVTKRLGPPRALSLSRQLVPVQARCPLRAAPRRGLPPTAGRELRVWAWKQAPRPSGEASAIVMANCPAQLLPESQPQKLAGS